MSLDNIQLSPFLLGELYKNSLVDIEIEESETGILKQEKLLFLGGNKKHILIIVNEENGVYLTDEDLNFLVDILTACKLSLSDTVLVNLHMNPGVDYEKLQTNFQPEIILFFGTEPAKLGFPLQFPHYQLQHYNNQVYLSSPPLKHLAAEKQQKLQLWACLKKLFSI